MTIPNPIIPTEAPMANAIDDVKAATYLEKIRPMMAEAQSVVEPIVGGPEGESIIGYRLPTGWWLMLQAHIRNLIDASPAPSQHTGWSDEAVEALRDARRYVAYLAGDDRTFVGSGMPSECLARIDEALAASSIAPATGFEVKADRDSVRFAQQFADMYRSGAQGAEMDCDAAQALALAIDDILASSISPSVAKESGEP